MKPASSGIIHNITNPKGAEYKIYGAGNNMLCTVRAKGNLVGWGDDFFLMDDDQREAEDRYDRADFVLCSNYAQDHPHPDCPADDDSFREIWRGSFLELDHENRVLIYSVPNDDGEPTPARFDYSLW